MSIGKYRELAREGYTLRELRGGNGATGFVVRAIVKMDTEQVLTVVRQPGHALTHGTVQDAEGANVQHPVRFRFGDPTPLHADETFRLLGGVVQANPTLSQELTRVILLQQASENAPATAE